MAAKVALAAKMKLRGVFFWELGHDTIQRDVAGGARHSLLAAAADEAALQIVLAAARADTEEKEEPPSATAAATAADSAKAVGGGDGYSEYSALGACPPAPAANKAPTAWQQPLV